MIIDSKSSSITQMKAKILEINFDYIKNWTLYPIFMLLIMLTQCFLKI